MSIFMAAAFLLPFLIYPLQLRAFDLEGTALIHQKTTNNAANCHWCIGAGRSIGTNKRGVQ
jgi:hypothetical protein